MTLSARDYTLLGRVAYALPPTSTLHNLFAPDFERYWNHTNRRQRRAKRLLEWLLRPLFGQQAFYTVAELADSLNELENRQLVCSKRLVASDTIYYELTKTGEAALAAYRQDKHAPGHEPMASQRTTLGLGQT